jgi:hypothetical protein
MEMPTIQIAVKNKIAASPVEQLVCGNSDYQIEFLFDEEWDSLSVKTARFVWNGQKQDVVFEGNTCPVPVISNATTCLVGVYAGDLRTTTPALVGCRKSVLCEGGLPADPAPDVYAQIMEMLQNMGGGAVTEEQIAAAVEEYFAEHPIDIPSGGGGLTTAQISAMDDLIRIAA